VWKLELDKLSLIKAALTSSRAAKERELALRGYHSFKGKETELYITYLPDQEPGPFSIKDSCIWKGDMETVGTLLRVAQTQRHSLAVYAKTMLSAKDSTGSPIYPAARIDVKIAYKVATALPETHPARSTYRIKNPAPIVFYDEPDVDGGSTEVNESP
jgi:hypothetical protein